MQIVLALIGLLGAFGYWFFVIERTGKAVSEVADITGRARGAYRRRRFRLKAEASQIDAIDDPRTAATVIAIAIGAPDGILDDGKDAALRNAMANIMGIEDPTDHIVFAQWALGDKFDANNVSLRLARLLNATLTIAERKDLVDLVCTVASADVATTTEQDASIRLLRRRLLVAA